MKAPQNHITVFSTYFYVYGGDSVKNRLANILNMSKKKKGVAAAITILSLIILPSMLVACNSTTTVPPSSSQELSSPVEVVTQYLVALKNNDNKALAATLTPDYDVSDEKLGVISLKIIEVKEETNPRYMEEAFEGEIAKENGWTKDNLYFVYASYDVQYDNKIVPSSSGRQEDVFTLMRSDKNSPWLIKYMGHARF